MLLCTACIDEDNSDCPPNEAEVTLLFNYYFSPGGPNRFLERVTKVNVGIYNEEGVRVYRQQIDRDSLEVFQGMKLKLPLGHYEAFCWGNKYENTEIDWDNGLVYHTDFYKPDVNLRTYDNLTYGYLSFDVTHGENRYYIDSEPAFLDFEIAVMNASLVLPDGIYSDAKGNKETTIPVDENMMPYIRMSHLNTEVYDFYMNDKDNGEETNLYPIGTYNPSADVLVYKTHTHRLENDNPVKIELVKSNATKEVLEQTLLKEYIQRHPEYTIQPKTEETIYITYQLYKTDHNTIEVKVWPIQWGRVDVIPIFP
jgi:hypothetical protein